MRTLSSATLPACVRACYVQRRNKERDGLDQSFTLREGELRVHVAAAELPVRRPPLSVYAGSGACVLPPAG